MELSGDFRKQWKKLSKTALEEQAILDPRRSKRIMLNRSSAKNSNNKKRLEEDMLKQKVKSLQARASALAAALATLEMETIDLSNENSELKELHKAMMNRLHQQNARNEKIKLEIQWLKKMTSNPAMASRPFPFNPGNAADLLPNLQGHKHSAETPPRLAEASSSAAGGDDALPRCTGDDDHSPDDPLGNNGLIEGSGKLVDPTPTD